MDTTILENAKKMVAQLQLAIDNAEAAKADTADSIQALSNVIIKLVGKEKGEWCKDQDEIAEACVGVEGRRQWVMGMLASMCDYDAGDIHDAILDLPMGARESLLREMITYDQYTAKTILIEDDWLDESDVIDWLQHSYSSERHRDVRDWVNENASIRGKVVDLLSDMTSAEIANTLSQVCEPSDLVTLNASAEWKE